MVLALVDGIYVFDTQNQDLHFVRSHNAHVDHCRIRSGVGPDGALWITGMGREGSTLMTRLAADGSVSEVEGFDGAVLGDFAWAFDGKAMYWTDPTRRWLGRWSFDPVTGHVARSSAPVALDAQVGPPSATAIDVEGACWLCDGAAGAVTRFSAEGKVLERIELGTTSPTTCCLGGKDMKLLFIGTSRATPDAPATEGVLNAGGIFMVRVDVPGVVTDRYAGRF